MLKDYSVIATKAYFFDFGFGYQIVLVFNLFDSGFGFGIGFSNVFLVYSGYWFGCHH